MARIFPLNLSVHLSKAKVLENCIRLANSSSAHLRCRSSNVLKEMTTRRDGSLLLSGPSATLGVHLTCLAFLLQTTSRSNGICVLRHWSPNKRLLQQSFGPCHRRCMKARQKAQTHRPSTKKSLHKAQQMQSMSGVLFKNAFESVLPSFFLQTVDRQRASSDLVRLLRHEHSGSNRCSDQIMPCST